jgi:hemerythrin-like domain-containing protein
MIAQTSSQADTRVYQVVHDVFRLATNRLVDAAEKLEPSALQPVIGQYWNFYAAVLHHHHHNEDESIFPVLLAVRPDMADFIKTLEDDHRQLIRSMDDVDSAIAGFDLQPDASHQKAVWDAAVGVREMFFPHLDAEDERILPAVAQSIPPKEWTSLDRAALKSIPREYLPRAVAALDEIIQKLPKGDQPPPPPPPIRVMLAVSWRKKWSAFVQPLVV